jgi:amino acid adenylation domain-containing protein
VPTRPALVVDGHTLTYAELGETARRIAATLQRCTPDTTPPFTAVLAHRSHSAFAGILGALMAGHGYVPLNPSFPLGRTKQMLDSAGCRAIVVDAASLPQLGELLEATDTPTLVVVPEVSDVTALRQRWTQHAFAGADDLDEGHAWRAPATEPNAIAYLMFTSGSTGTPKGVMVTHRNVRSFVEYMVARYEVDETDRFSQMFETTFDPSVFDMFVCWEAGACLYCPSAKDAVSPGRFIQDAGLTIWFSVPSRAVLMKRLGLLKPGRYPTLRLSLFAGEPLPASLVTAWAAAAPNSVIENLYGPTELTIACTYYRWDDDTSPGQCELGITPIGAPYPGMTVLVVDEELREVAPGTAGELLMSGPQMALGYWKDPSRTADAFVRPPGHHETYYRTGDRVRRPFGDGPLTHLGRVDAQVKIRGHRVELGEIEAVVRAVSGLDGVVAVPWPRTESGYDGVEVFVEADVADAASIRAAVTARLPAYMVPRRIHVRDRLPRNGSDKYDRIAMTTMLAETT